MISQKWIVIVVDVTVVQNTEKEHQEKKELKILMYIVAAIVKKHTRRKTPSPCIPFVYISISFNSK